MDSKLNNRVITESTLKGGAIRINSVEDECLRESLTLVSSFLSREPGETDENIREHYLFLLSLKIPFYIFVHPDFDEAHLIPPCLDGSYVVYTTIDLSNSRIFENNGYEVDLPRHRNETKDTLPFLIEGHTKYECLERAIQENFWNSTHFAWIDFHISKIVKNKPGISEFFQYIQSFIFENNGVDERDVIISEKTFLTMPGCWSKWDKNSPQEILDAVHWRFCGGFLIGDAQSVLELCDLHREVLPLFLQEHKKIVWDFNFLAWLETTYEDRWKAIQYKADHNDSLFLCSADYYSKCCDKHILRKKEYNYLPIETYYPSSASHLFFQGEHWLNTRYVNYWIYPNGCYLFQNKEGKHIIENKNIISRLDPESLEPLYYKEVEERVDYPVTNEKISVGLEDIRLYEFDGKVKYIAATTGFSPNGKSRMMIGDYWLEEGVLSGGKIFQPPGNVDSWCEKNWIPLIRGEKEYFIYKWYPLEIGHLDYDMGELVIDFSIPVSFPLFSKIKGSTIFHEVPDGLLGVVHFSEDHAIRHYFHMMVLLDRDTFEIKNYSEPFCFEKIGVEYCIGFFPNRDVTQYTFWISRHDRDPLMIQMASNEIRWFIEEEVADDLPQ